MTTTMDEANAALRRAVADRMTATPADDPKMVGYQAPEACSDAYSAWTPPDYARREQAIAGFRQLVDDARPARQARAGTTAKFGTGAIRSDTFEAYRYDLVSPIGLREVARACAEGAAKYSDFNWERGMPVHDLLNHAIAHVYQYLAGDRSEPHLGHAAWGLLAAIHSDQLWPELNAGTLRGEGCVAPVERLS